MRCSATICPVFLGTPLLIILPLSPKGYKAAGDTEALRRLGAQYGLEVSIVDLVESESLTTGGRASSAVPPAGAASMVYASGSSMDVVTVRDLPLEAGSSSDLISSSRARELLSKGDVRGVSRLMGRCYRLVAAVDHVSGGDPRCCINPSAAGLSEISRSDKGTSGRLESLSSAGAASTSNPGFSRYSGGGGVGGRSVAVVPTASLLNLPPKDGVYEASLSAVYRGPPSWSRTANLPMDLLPSELESGSGIAVKVRIDGEGLHLSRDALDSAVAASSPTHDNGSSSDGGAAAVYVVIDFWL